MSKRIKRRPTNAEIGGPLPAKRDYKHWHDGGPGGAGQIPVHVGKGNPGRPPGAVNKLGREVKTAIIDAAELSRHSKDGTLRGYLVFLADEHPVTYAKLISRLVPYVVHGNVQLQSVAEIRAELVARGVPLPPSLYPVPKVPGTLARREPPAPSLQRREPPRPVNLSNDLNNSPPEPERRHDNMFGSSCKVEPYVPGPPYQPIGEQFEFNYPSQYTDFNLMCGEHSPRRPRLAVSNPEKESTDERTEAAE
jgi:hypothetical protein